jgi:RNA polymerase sigma-70 factor (ECF subfamily)
MARIALNDSQDALDVVQDAMFKLVKNYRKRDSQEWPKLFQRILHNCINDRFRGSGLRARFFTMFNSAEDLDRALAYAPAPEAIHPPRIHENEHLGKTLEEAIRKLPARQRQAFLLRAWDGCSVRECAQLMQCSEGSVKSHYARAQQHLRDRLEAYQ